MNQLISNVLMQPTDAVERLTLIEKLKQLSDKYFNQYKYYGDNADLNCSSAVDEAINIVKQHNEWVSVNERLPPNVTDEEKKPPFVNSFDYRIITEALYHLATNDSLEVGDKALAELTDDELENRLLCLREKIARLESKSRSDDYYL